MAAKMRVWSSRELSTDTTPGAMPSLASSRRARLATSGDAATSCSLAMLTEAYDCWPCRGSEIGATSTCAELW